MATGTIKGGIGTYYDSDGGSKTLNANNSTIYTGASLTLPAGSYMISAFLQISGTVAGTRQGCTITTDNTAGEFNQSCYTLQYQPATVTNINQYHNICSMFSPVSTTTYYLMAFNGSVSTALHGWLFAIRIA